MDDGVGKRGIYSSIKGEQDGQATKNLFQKWVKLNKQGITATTRGLWATFRVSQKTWRRARFEKFFRILHAILIK
jgi:hypothetical protein